MRLLTGWIRKVATLCLVLNVLLLAIVVSLRALLLSATALLAVWLLASCSEPFSVAAASSASFGAAPTDASSDGPRKPLATAGVPSTAWDGAILQGVGGSGPASGGRPSAVSGSGGLVRPASGGAPAKTGGAPNAGGAVSGSGGGPLLTDAGEPADSGKPCEVCSIFGRCCAPGQACDPFFGCK